MDDDLIQVDPAVLAKWNRAVPRYTSYPTAPQFFRMEQSQAIEKLQAFDRSAKPLSLYVHIPFCKTMCLFCGCSVVLNRKPERQQDYLDHLLFEIERTSKTFSHRRSASQLHLGGGTPTSLTEAQFARLMNGIRTHFILTPSAEISIEIDPRTVYADGGRKLTALRNLGFNRISFGVQDLDPRVQEAVRRRQTEEMTVAAYDQARKLGFQGINIDLIYGLPLQTPAGFAKTAEKLIQLKPDRIALYSYAKVPWLKPHQKAIPEETLPSTEEKFGLYVDARRRFMKAGYLAIGMDHFCLPSDPMAEAYLEGKLTRNFQGYSVELAEDMIGFGASAISFIENAYFQNIKELDRYQTAIGKGDLPIGRGYILHEEDLLRRRIIQSLMCHFEIDSKYRNLADLDELDQGGLIDQSAGRIKATPLGRVLIRIIASKFDAYLNRGQFSRAV